MQEASGNAPANTQNIKLIDMLIAQWSKRSTSDIPHQTEEASENSCAQESMQHALQRREHIIQDLKRKLKESHEAAASLSTSLETETRNKEEIRIKLNATWESIETITEYFNYISESLTSFQQHCVNLSGMYDNIILKQQEAIKKLQLDNVNSKELQTHATQLKSTLHLREERLQEAILEQDKLRKQLENNKYELQSQKNELNIYTKEKSTLVEVQQRLILENEDLKQQLQTIEKEKCDTAQLATQLEKKLLFQEEKMQNILTEQNKLQEQVKNGEREFYSQINNLQSTHIEEKKKLVEQQQHFLSEIESLQSQINKLEEVKNNVTDITVQKDALISTLQEEIFKYKNEMKMMRTNTNEANTKYETLIHEQNMREKELLMKKETVQNLEAMLSVTKQRENKLINDINRLEKKLTNEMNYSKDLLTKLSNTEKNLQLAQKNNIEMQKALDKTKNSEFTNIELQQQLKTLQKEKEEILKRENSKIKNAEILYENTQAKHGEEVSALKNDHKTQLSELKNTIDSLNDTINNIRKENTALNKSLIKIREENSNLKRDSKSTTEHNENLREKLKEATETLLTKFMENKKLGNEFTASQSNIFTDYKDDEKNKSSSTSPYSISSRENQKEQEAEVTSAGRKFFKSRSGQPRTYTKRRF